MAATRQPETPSPASDTPHAELDIAELLEVSCPQPLLTTPVVFAISGEAGHARTHTSTCKVGKANGATVFTEPLNHRQARLRLCRSCLPYIHREWGGIDLASFLSTLVTEGHKQLTVADGRWADAWAALAHKISDTIDPQVASWANRCGGHVNVGVYWAHQRAPVGEPEWVAVIPNLIGWGISAAEVITQPASVSQSHAAIVTSAAGMRRLHAAHKTMRATKLDAAALQHYAPQEPDSTNMAELNAKLSVVCHLADHNKEATGEELWGIAGALHNNLQP